MTRWSIGADGARAGWVVVVLRDGSVDRAAVVPDLAEALVWRDDWHGIGVDMPIGLVDDPVRDAEVAARAMLPGRASTVFGVPARTVIDEVRTGDLDDHAAASARNAEVTGRGLSIQTWGLVPRIVEVDGLRDRWPELLEVHPETAFAALAGTPLVRKTCWEGVARRRELLARRGVDPPARFRGSADVAPDDVLDAAVVAWVADGDGAARLTLPAIPTQQDRGRDVVMTVRRP